MAPGRRRPGQHPLKRRISVRQPRKTIVIFCEGERTEPEYLEALRRQPWVRDTAAVDLRVERPRGGNDPSTLVTRAVRARLKALEEKDEIDEFWCVFDVEWPENHAGLEDAVEAAERQGVHLAISNPCFELWLILHFKEHRGWLENDRARRIRRGLDGSGDKGIDADRYMPCVREAAMRAVTLEQQHLNDGRIFPRDNPSSGMHRLIDSIGNHPAPSAD